MRMGVFLLLDLVRIDREIEFFFFFHPEAFSSRPLRSENPVLLQLRNWRG